MNTNAALKLLDSATRGTFDFWDLAGSNSAKIRSEIMSILAGHRVPQAKAGVTAMRAAFFPLAGIEPGPSTRSADAFAVWAREQISDSNRRAGR